MSRDAFRQFYAVPDEEELPGVAYEGPRLYEEAYDPRHPMPGQPGYGVVADEPIMAQRADEAELARRAAARSAGANRLRRQLRSAAEDDTVPYSPIAVGMNAVPFSDEILGYIASRGENAPTYDEAQQAFSDIRATESQEHPWSALAGGIGQMAITAPLTLAAPIRSPTAFGVLEAALPTTAAGTALGAAGGLLTSRPGHRLEDAASGAGTGALMGTIAGIGGGAGQALRQTALAPATSTLGAIGRNLAAGAAEGVGIAATQAPDLSNARIRDLPGVLETFGEAVPYAAGAGAGMAAAGELAALPIRGAARLRERIGSFMGESPTPASARPQYDEAMETIAGAVDDSGLPGLATEALPDMASSVERGRSAAATAGQTDAGMLTRLGLRQDPAMARLQSLGMTQADIDRASASFGGARNLVEAARDVGLLRERSVYDPSTEIAAAAQMRDDAGRVVQDYYRRLRASGVEVSGAEIADDIQAQADRFLRLDDPRARARGMALQELANDYRYGAGVRPVDDMPLLERTLTPDDLLANLRYRSDTNQQIWRTPSERVRPEQQSMLDVQRAEIAARNRASEAAFTPEEHAQLRDAQNRYRVGRALAGPEGATPGIDARQFGGLRSWMGIGPGADAMRSVPGMNNPVGSAIGGAAGFVAGRLGSRYQPSIMATLNESGTMTMPEALASAARALRESVRTGGAAAIDDATASALDAIASNPPRSQADVTRALDTVRGAARAIGTPEAARSVQAAEAMSDWPSFLRGVERVMRTSPEKLGTIADALSAAISRGALAANVFTMVRNNPEARARLVSAVESTISDDESIADEEQAIAARHRRMLGTSEPVDDETEEEREALRARWERMAGGGSR